MSATQTWILRSSVVSGMVVAVVTVLYFTPMPEHHFKSCERVCHDLDWPMICRIKLNVELYHTLGKWCEGCPGNSSDCWRRHCVPADGHQRALLTANRQLPGPAIQVCQNDIVVVDVANRVAGQEFTIHWRGQHMQATPCMDGVPMVSQCSVPSHTTFQYKFRAASAGTHLWHAFSHAHRADGVFGALVVHRPDRREPQRRLYDQDDKAHVLVITEWNRNATSSFQHAAPIGLLVNGRNNFGGHVPQLAVKSGQRYRFRVAYASGASACPVHITVDKHRLRVIALDGNPTVPYQVASVVLGRGERVDFVLKASEASATYDVQVTSRCAQVPGVVLALRYDEHAVQRAGPQVPSAALLPTDAKRVLYTDVCDRALGKVCVNHVQSLFVMPASLRQPQLQHHLYFMLQNDRGRIPAVNNITFTFPSSPLQTQLEDVDPDSMCNQGDLPDRCVGSAVCDCVHLEQVPLGSAVEMILVDTSGNEQHTFHMHGHSFYVVGYHQFSAPVSLETIQEMDKKGKLFKRNLKSAAQKDTVRVPKLGAVAIRFQANNPGFWLMRDENSHHWTRGMDFVLQVGRRRDLQSTPSNFPTCGNWIGPEFFLA